MERIPGLILAFTMLAILIAVAVYIIMKIRDAGKNTKTTGAQERLSLFGRLYDEGELTKEEFRAIRSSLTDAISEELEQLRAERENADRVDSDRKLQELLGGRRK